jgi:hypothetical protein
MARYKLIGAEIEGQEINQSTPTHDQQVTDARGSVVYETDDRAEANAILQAGGFFRNRDNFIAVTRVVDAQAVVSGPGDDKGFLRPASPFPQKGT